MREDMCSFCVCRQLKTKEGKWVRRQNLHDRVSGVTEQAKRRQCNGGESGTVHRHLRADHDRACLFDSHAGTNPLMKAISVATNLQLIFCLTTEIVLLSVFCKIRMNFIENLNYICFFCQNVAVENGPPS